MLDSLCTVPGRTPPSPSRELTTEGILRILELRLLPRESSPLVRRILAFRLERLASESPDWREWPILGKAGLAGTVPGDPGAIARFLFETWRAQIHSQLAAAAWRRSLAVRCALLEAREAEPLPARTGGAR